MKNYRICKQIQHIPSVGQEYIVQVSTHIVHAYLSLTSKACNRLSILVRQVAPKTKILSELMTASVAPIDFCAWMDNWPEASVHSCTSASCRFSFGLMMGKSCALQVLVARLIERLGRLQLPRLALLVATKLREKSGDSAEKNAYNCQNEDCIRGSIASAATSLESVHLILLQPRLGKKERKCHVSLKVNIRTVVETCMCKDICCDIKCERRSNKKNLDIHPQCNLTLFGHALHPGIYPNLYSDVKSGM